MFCRIQRFKLVGLFKASKWHWLNHVIRQVKQQPAGSAGVGRAAVQLSLNLCGRAFTLHLNIGDAAANFCRGCFLQPRINESCWQYWCHRGQEVKQQPVIAAARKPSESCTEGLFWHNNFKEIPSSFLVPPKLIERRSSRIIVLLSSHLEIDRITHTHFSKSLS